MALDLDAFMLPGMPSFQKNERLVEDASIYYAVVGEMCYKTRALIYYAGYTVDGEAYGSLGEALRDTWERLKVHEFRDQEQKEFVLQSFNRAMKDYGSSCLLLAAPIVAPGQPVPAASVGTAQRFSYLYADVLFHLTRFGSAEAYLESGFAIPGLMIGPFMPEAFNNMLKAYEFALNRLIGSSC